MSATVTIVEDCEECAGCKYRQTVLETVKVAIDKPYLKRMTEALEVYERENRWFADLPDDVPDEKLDRYTEILDDLWRRYRRIECEWLQVREHAFKGAWPFMACERLPRIILTHDS